MIASFVPEAENVQIEHEFGGIDELAVLLSHLNIPARIAGPFRLRIFNLQCESESLLKIEILCMSMPNCSRSSGEPKLSNAVTMIWKPGLVLAILSNALKKSFINTF